ncbi:hypothetical protein ACWCXX_30140 [Streptomyces sp. NPDC001732]
MVGRELDVLQFHQQHVYAPSLGEAVEDVLDPGIERLGVGEHLVEQRTADDGAHGGLADHGPLDVEAREAVGVPVPVTGLVPRLCADLAQLIGGELRWEATTGGGLTAVLSLPAAAESGREARRAAD